MKSKLKKVVIILVLIPFLLPFIIPACRVLSRAVYQKQVIEATSTVRYGDWLIMGTRGEGLVLVNTKTNYSKRVPEPANASVLRVKGATLIINNHTEMDLQSLTK